MYSHLKHQQYSQFAFLRIKEQELLRLNALHLDSKTIQTEISLSSDRSLCRPEYNAATIHVTLSKLHQPLNDTYHMLS